MGHSPEEVTERVLQTGRFNKHGELVLDCQAHIVDDMQKDILFFDTKYGGVTNRVAEGARVAVFSITGSYNLATTAHEATFLMARDILTRLERVYSGGRHVGENYRYVTAKVSLNSDNHVCNKVLEKMIEKNDPSLAIFHTLGDRAKVLSAQFSPFPWIQVAPCFTPEQSKVLKAVGAHAWTVDGQDDVALYNKGKTWRWRSAGPLGKLTGQISISRAGEKPLTEENGVDSVVQSLWLAPISSSTQRECLKTGDLDTAVAGGFLSKRVVSILPGMSARGSQVFLDWCGEKKWKTKNGDKLTKEHRDATRRILRGNIESNR